ncbi:hypothetical protein K438DRAFT_1679159 [Mycena galopus ATCC 62051]|nr:hypothetical protein K438DRAFT_1679159 [Mycena galopus ATCC 62051]
MSAALTFTHEDLLNSSVNAPDGAVYYTTITTKGLRGRKITTVTAASGLVGTINWREKSFVINGVERVQEDLKERSAGIFSSEREWHWGNIAYKLKYHNLKTELLATPTNGDGTGTIRFTPYTPHRFDHPQRATISFTPQLVDENERMFLLMAILQTEVHPQDIMEAATTWT